MGSLSDAEKKKLAYFHALGKAMTEGNQEVYESRYKSSHNVRLTEVWADHINSAVTYSAAVAEASTNSAVTLYTQVTLTQIPGSNGQTYYYDSGGTFVRPWISPVDVPNSITNTPSDGYQVLLYKGNGSPIYLTDGAWAVDYYAGIIHFSVGYTPADLGWGAIKATFFQYSGTYGASGGTSNAFTTAVFDSGTSHLIFNSGQPSQTIIDLSPLAGDSSISTALSVEVSTRTSGDTSLSTAITVEQSTRGSSDASLSSALSLNNSGITSLSTALSAVISGNTYDDTSLSSAISVEQSTRGSVDTSLSTTISTSISGEASTRGSVDTSLSIAILGAGGGTGVTSLSTALSVEESSRISSDTVLSQAIADIVSGITSSGGTIASSNIGMSASTTVLDGDLACVTGVTSLPIPKSYISVYINGVQVSVGDGTKLKDCYFSSDGGTTPKLWTNIGLSDLLYWNGSIIGYQLSSTTDKVSFIYLTI